MTAVFADGQTTKQSNRFNFASKEFKIPANCQLETSVVEEQQPKVRCENYSISWFPQKNATDKMLESALDEASKNFAEAKNFQKTPITVYLLGEEVNGFKISFENENSNQTRYSIIAAGRVNGQPLFLQLVTDREVKTDDDLSDFAKQIIKLSK